MASKTWCDEMALEPMAAGRSTKYRREEKQHHHQGICSQVGGQMTDCFGGVVSQNHSPRPRP